MTALETVAGADAGVAAPELEAEAGVKVLSSTVGVVLTVFAGSFLETTLPLS
jgi:hypothetical protein